MLESHSTPLQVPVDPRLDKGQCFKLTLKKRVVTPCMLGRVGENYLSAKTYHVAMGLFGKSVCARLDPSLPLVDRMVGSVPNGTLLLVSVFSML